MSNVLPLRRLLLGPRPAPDRILFTELWLTKSQRLGDEVGPDEAGPPVTRIRTRRA